MWNAQHNRCQTVQRPLNSSTYASLWRSSSQSRQTAGFSARANLDDIPTSFRNPDRHAAPTLLPARKALGSRTLANREGASSLSSELGFAQAPAVVARQALSTFGAGSTQEVILSDGGGWVRRTGAARGLCFGSRPVTRCAGS